FAVEVGDDHVVAVHVVVNGGRSPERPVPFVEEHADPGALAAAHRDDVVLAVAVQVAYGERGALCHVLIKRDRACRDLGRRAGRGRGRRAGLAAAAAAATTAAATAATATAATATAAGGGAR